MSTQCGSCGIEDATTTVRRLPMCKSCADSLDPIEAPAEREPGESGLQWLRHELDRAIAKASEEYGGPLPPGTHQIAWVSDSGDRLVDDRITADAPVD